MTNEELFFNALKSHRESKDIEISEICEFTNIHPRYIEAIESGDFSVLPTVYMRLFLKAYANFIGADSAKTLEDFELHTTGKVQKRADFGIKPTEDTGNLGEMKEKMEPTGQVSPKQIVTGAAVIIGLFLVLYWAGQITNQQENVVGEKPEPVEVTEPTETAPHETEALPAEESEEGLEEKKSPVIDEEATVLGTKKSEKTLPSPVKKIVAAISPEVVEEKPSNLPNRLPLNTNDFLIENRKRETTNIIKIFEPYSITILTLEETKLNISKSNEDKLTELMNAVASSGEIFQFDFQSTINFEFWNSAHVRVKLNEIPLDTYLSINDGLSVRGSYEANKSQLYLGFYQN